ncbi:Na+/H+ antiporter NhaA [Rhodospirillum sp. A1_3_36]|uniref:Na+/H+ antiporter NhaA n=1 Tax=Rhodospirillum sp. A1_3_36 TaxID=3391666 RepID=UPI0039A6A589
MDKIGKVIDDFLRMEASGGLVLMAMAALALIVANTPLVDTYDLVFWTPFTIGFGETLVLSKPLLLWINDGLMAIFFFLVGLEVKREFLAGELSSREKALLPAIAAVGGMAAPALVYLAIAGGDPLTARGWAIPAATDIAFALGVLALLGSRIPLALKVFLTAVAIFDDLGAIIIIALFYTDGLSLPALGIAAVAIVALFALNRGGVRSTAPYLVVGLILWIAVLKSGVHATLAGVIIAMAIPMAKDTKGHSPLEHMEHALHRWVAFGVLPIFAFANAGVPLSGLGPDAVTGPIPMGILFGLLIGKPLGILLSVGAAVFTGVCRLPEGTSWGQVAGLSFLAGIGFTMSLFIGTLAFPADPAIEAGVRIGVLGGSVLSATIGFLILRWWKGPAAAVA